MRQGMDDRVRDDSPELSIGMDKWLESLVLNRLPTKHFDTRDLCDPGCYDAIHIWGTENKGTAV